LGAAEGNTLSHISEIIKNGFAIGTDISFVAMNDFLKLCESKKNLIPLLADARLPEKYPKEILNLQFDILYQDIAQREQAEIFIKHKKFLKKKGYGYLILKVRSISSQKTPKQIMEETAKKLAKEFKVLEIVDLEPYQKEHFMLVVKNE
jgi:fibrillarin-like pre-rRNA processing protein